MSPGWTMYTIQPSGGPQGYHHGVGLAYQVGGATGVNVGGTAVSAVGDEGVSGGGEGDIVGRGVGWTTGKYGVGDGESTATAWVGAGRTPNVSSWLSRKPPNSKPTLMSVMAMLPSNCLTPVTWLALKCIRPLTVVSQPRQTRSAPVGRRHPRTRVAG